MAAQDKFGTRKGIEADETSNCCLEVLLFTLFRQAGRNPFELEYMNQAGCPEPQKLLKGKLYSDVIISLRYPPFLCTQQKFKTCLQGLIGTVQVTGIDQALENLGRVLQVPKFIQYLAGNQMTTEAYTHQVILPTRQIAVKQADVATLLGQSMEHQHLAFAAPPYPGLFIHLPRSATVAGELVGVVHVIPSLSLNICGVIFTLWGIVIKDDSGRCRSFVREVTPDGAGVIWSYFAPKTKAGGGAPKVTFCRSLEEQLFSLVKGHGAGHKVRDYTLEVKRILGSAITYIYVPPPDFVRQITRQQSQDVPPPVPAQTPSAVDSRIPAQAPQKTENQSYGQHTHVPTTTRGPSIHGSNRISGPPPAHQQARPAATGGPTQGPIVAPPGPGSRFGLGKGIEGHNNSCYIDVLLFSMFYETEVFDPLLLNTPVRNQLGLQAQNHIRQRIVTLLRNPPYVCPKDEVNTLRAILKDTNMKVTGQMMDIDELIGDLFRKVLALEPFIKYNVGTTNYLHQIMLGGRGSKFATVKSMLVSSLAVQGLQFAGTPFPALFLKMPRSKGVLAGGLEFILPSRTLKAKDFGFDSDLSLLAVVCIQHHHYTVFVRGGIETRDGDCWIYFDSMSPRWGPEVTPLPGLEAELRDFGQRLSHEADMAFNWDEFSKPLQKFLKTSHVYIYIQMETQPTTGDAVGEGSPHGLQHTRAPPIEETRPAPGRSDTPPPADSSPTPGYEIKTPKKVGEDESPVSYTSGGPVNARALVPARPASPAKPTQPNKNASHPAGDGAGLSQPQTDQITALPHGSIHTWNSFPHPSRGMDRVGAAREQPPASVNHDLRHPERPANEYESVLNDGRHLVLSKVQVGGPGPGQEERSSNMSSASATPAGAVFRKPYANKESVDNPMSLLNRKGNNAQSSMPAPTEQVKQKIATVLIAVLRGGSVNQQLAPDHPMKASVRSLYLAQSEKDVADCAAWIGRLILQHLSVGHLATLDTTSVIREIVDVLGAHLELPLTAVLFVNGGLEPVCSLTICAARRSTSYCVATVQDLLQESMNDAKLKFRSTPKCLVLMFKPPVPERDQTRSIVPNTVLNVSTLIQYSSNEILLGLSAVICCENGDWFTYYRRNGNWLRWDAAKQTEIKLGSFDTKLEAAEKWVKGVTPGQPELSRGLLKSTVAVVYIQL